ncbi:hypothetical protein TNCV_571361 [Trichonephila clavipes]|nr:hypothetical protein TNCV_571361 [Trichonephila clavipes]
MFVYPLMVASKAALESEKIASPSVVPESSRWVEYRMSASLIARSWQIQETKLAVQLINTTSERRLDQRYETTPLRVKGDTEDVSSELDNEG